jgi:hypothetical protein
VDESLDETTPLDITFARTPQKDGMQELKLVDGTSTRARTYHIQTVWSFLQNNQN